MQLFNDQELINMNQEKARKYLLEIDEWLRETNRLLDEQHHQQRNGHDIESNKSSKLFSSFGGSPNVEGDFMLADMSARHSSSLFSSEASAVIVVADDSKQNSLFKSIELITSQIRSLVSMFEKRREQLRKSAYPASNRPVQRVEPQLCASSSPAGFDLILDTSSGVGKIHHIHHQNNNNSTSSSLIKRESMHKVNTKILLISKLYNYFFIASILQSKRFFFVVVDVFSYQPSCFSYL